VKRLIIKRWYFWVTVLVFLPLLFVSVGLIYSGQGPVNQANFDRVELGMTEQQVVAILGEPTLRRGSGLQTPLCG
jgi:outer membrane protein assembly factor BamE (lipoprotein component of BamABCDE complex)